LKPTELIEQPYDKGIPTAQVEVGESYLPYVTEYSMGFWYQFRFRSPVRMDLDKKRADRHAVAGVTEGDFYTGKKMGDQSLSLFFEPWDSTDKPTYSFCTYDLLRDKSSVCEKIEFNYHNVDAYWFYVYSGYSAKQQKTYSAFFGNDQFKGVTVPSISHTAPPSKLQFNLGSRKNTLDAINGYFYHVEFNYKKGAFLGTEDLVRDYVKKISTPKVKADFKKFFKQPEGEIAVSKKL